MARPFTGWIDDQGQHHATEAEAVAADERHLRALAIVAVKQCIYQAIDWERQKLDLGLLLANRATLVVNLERLPADVEGLD